MGQVRRQPNRRAHCDQVKTEGPPSLVRGGALLLFPGVGSRERSGRDPTPVLPIPHPMDEVHGGKMFWRQLNSRFGNGQIRNLGSYVIFYL